MFLSCRVPIKENSLILAGCFDIKNKVRLSGRKISTPLLLKAKHTLHKFSSFPEFRVALP